MNTEINKDTQDDFYSEYKRYFTHLFLKARDSGGLDFIYTLLRVSGIEDGGWDPFVEAEDSLKDLSVLLRGLSEDGRNKTALRLALLLYCHSIEMSAPYQILFNLLRCCQKKNYIFMPFFELDKNGKIIPKYPKNKIEVLESEAKKSEEEELISHLNSFFDNHIRNAFFHSDYTIEDDFRICESRPVQVIKKEILTEKIKRCFAFYQAFMDTYREAKMVYVKAEKIYPLKNFDVFELLVDEKEGLVGFKMHYPREDGMCGYYERRKDRIRGLNFMIENDGIRFHCGLLSEIKNVHMMNGSVYKK